MTVEEVAEDAPLKDAVAAIERGRKSIAVLVDAGGKLVGTVSDGDVRRALLRGLSLKTPARQIANLQPLTARSGTSAEDIARLMAARGLEAIPLVDERGRFVRTAYIGEITNIQGGGKDVGALWAAVIMAGGEGRRMMPLTRATPKPMLEVGGMPLMERNIRALIGLGVRRFYLSINYLGHVIEQHFGDGSALGAEIRYLRETEPLGTGGALRLIEEKPDGPVLLMNGDLMTGLDLGQMLEFHWQHGAQLTVAAKECLVEVPFGVLRLAEPDIIGLVEKPTERYLCNAGIYLMSPRQFDMLPATRHFNMTQLIEDGMVSGRKVVAFPMLELWKDVGTPQQLDEARKLVELGEIANV